MTCPHVVVDEIDITALEDLPARHVLIQCRKCEAPSVELILGEDQS